MFCQFQVYNKVILILILPITCLIYLLSDTQCSNSENIVRTRFVSHMSHIIIYNDVSHHYKEDA